MSQSNAEPEELLQIIHCNNPHNPVNDAMDTPAWLYAIAKPKTVLIQTIHKSSVLQTRLTTQTRSDKCYYPTT
ncbi:hypothetical protein DPMN_034203 [Dreissena polymorpha]|uniref:Uncharacterized protein n=1 Tax=Dreissena polymorpha TaxID=45954 RepID=A0A9D4M736_DREPO|nr:hypothetical protein DPMN_034203 [Dreissena polymorpha]